MSVSLTAMDTTEEKSLVTRISGIGYLMRDRVGWFLVFGYRNFRSRKVSGLIRARKSMRNVRHGISPETDEYGLDARSALLIPCDFAKEAWRFLESIQTAGRRAFYTETYYPNEKRFVLFITNRCEYLD